MSQYKTDVAAIQQFINHRFVWHQIKVVEHSVNMELTILDGAESWLISTRPESA